LLHEIVHALDKPQAPVIGDPVTPEMWADRIGDPRAFMAWLRGTTLALGREAHNPAPRAGTGRR
jgi:hypothetical protein